MFLVVFYSFLKILKNIAFSFRGVFKYLFYSLLLIVFIMLCLLLLESSVFASYEGSAFDETGMLEGILPALDSVKGDYDSFTISLWYNGYNGVMINCFNKSDDLKIYYRNGQLHSNKVLSGTWHRYEGNSIISSGTFNTYMSNDVGMYNNEYYYFSNLPLYNENLTDILWNPPSESQVQEAYLDNYVNSTLYQKTIAGECPGLYIVNGDAESVYMYFYDITYLDDYGITEDNSFSYIFTKDSPFYLESKNGYAFPIAYLPFLYQNGHTYQCNLQYFIDGVSYDSPVYRWTTSFSADAIDWEYEHSNAILNNVSINNNSILTNLPKIDINYSGIEIGNNFFDMLKNIFTSNDYEDLVITLPDGETDVVIEPDYIENHCPAYIKLLIQTFYWYMIGRYIILDILRAVDKLRQGDFILSSDANIKTEVL